MTVTTAEHLDWTQAGIIHISFEGSPDPGEHAVLYGWQRTPGQRQHNHNVRYAGRVERVDNGPAGGGYVTYRFTNVDGTQPMVIVYFGPPAQ
jgi:hypothetical protein